MLTVEVMLNQGSAREDLLRERFENEASALKWAKRVTQGQPDYGYTLRVDEEICRIGGDGFEPLYPAIKVASADGSIAREVNALSLQVRYMQFLNDWSKPLLSFEEWRDRYADQAAAA